VLLSLLVIPLIGMAEAQQMIWSQLQTDAAPQARRSHAMAYDADSKAIILFGGFGNGTHLGDTWAFDTATKTWKNMQPANSPSPRAATSMVYDEVDRQTILFGGFGLGHSIVSNETWSYSYAENEWIKIDTETAPKERASYGMALDEKRRELVLFAGFTELGYYNDVWVYDIARQQWRSEDPGGERPSPRGAMSFVYDVRKDYFVMFGGFSDQGFYSDTWILDPEADAWVEVKPSTSPPAIRTRMIYDEDTGMSIFFGGDKISSEGHRGAPEPYDRTWSYDSSARAWTEITTPIAPSPRALNGIAFDSNTKSLVIFGGTDTLIDSENFVGREFRDTWVLSVESGAPGFDIWLVIAPLVAAIAAGIFLVKRKKLKLD
jgi:hypothetical protein